jgi:restriction endonuclease S subunit
MVSYSIIQKSQLEGALRLDAEYYQPEYLEVKRKLNFIKTKTISEISESVVSFGAYSLTNYIEWQKSGIPYLNVENIRDGVIDFDNVKFISEETDEILKKSRVKEGQVIITMAGTIGEAAVAHKIPPKVNSNQATAKITLKKGYSPYFLAAFLNSRYGKKQTEREIVSSVQPNIFLWQIKNFRVPIVPKEKQEEIEKVYIQGLEELEHSKSLYSQAEDLLLEELGLKDFKIEDDLFYIVNLSEVKSAHRADAEYFQPKYERLIERIKKYGAEPLLKVVENVPARFNPKSQPTKVFRYVELSNITSSIGIIDGFSEVSGEEAPSRAKRILKANDVIISSVEGSLEKVALVDKDQEGYLASNGFFQFRSKNILPEVLLVLAKSIVFQMQLEKQCAGTILTAVPKEAIQNILIPILPKPTQQKIADLVQKSHEARKKAKQLLEEARRKVEKLIEKN